MKRIFAIMLTGALLAFYGCSKDNSQRNKYQPSYIPEKIEEETEKSIHLDDYEITPVENVVKTTKKEEILTIETKCPYCGATTSVTIDFRNIVNYGFELHWGFQTVPWGDEDFTLSGEYVTCPNYNNHSLSYPLTSYTYAVRFQLKH